MFTTSEGNMEIFAVSEIADGLYCNRDINSETETYAANPIFIWHPVATSNSQEFSALFIC